MEKIIQGFARGYYRRRAAELLARVSLDGARKLALEIIIAEMHIRHVLRSGCVSDYEQSMLEDALKDIECAKSILYRAYRLGLIHAGKRRSWRVPG